MTSERLTERDLQMMAESPNEWREATCSKCGRTVVVAPQVKTLSCECIGEAEYRTLFVVAPPNRVVTNTETGPTVRERLIAEVRRLQKMLVGAIGIAMDGEFGSLHVLGGICDHGCGDPECNCVDEQHCPVRALEDEARLIREEADRG